MEHHDIRPLNNKSQSLALFESRTTWPNLNIQLNNIAVHQRFSQWEEDDIGGGRDFRQVAGFIVSIGIVEGVFCSFRAEIFEIVDCAAPVEMQVWPEPGIRNSSMST
jgi:hypothetical protein